MNGYRKRSMYACVCIHTVKYQPQKKESNLQFATTWMDLENIKWNKSHSEKQILYITYTWSLNNKTDDCIQQNRNRIADIENKLVVTTGEWEGGRDKIGVWD